MEENSYLLREDGTEPNGVSIRAVDILQQKFSVRFRGYDVQDVDSFLEVVAKELERLTYENTKIQEEVSVLRNSLEMYKKKEENIHAALVTVQKMADDVKKSAAEEAEKTISCAKNEAEKIVEEARHKSASINEDMGVMKGRAENEAQKVINDARAEADRIKDELQRAKSGYEDAMQHEKIKLQTEINTLTQRKIQFQTSLKALIETHQKLLESETE